MALSRVHTWNDGDTLEASDLNGEFNNILNNALTLISPLTNDLASGGNHITGLSFGSVAAASISVTGATSTGLYFPGAGTVGFTCAGVAGFYVGPVTNITTATIESNVGGGVGPKLQLWHNTTGQANNDISGTINFLGEGSDAATYTVAQIFVTRTSVDAASMTTTLSFAVQNAVAAGSVNTTATLSNLGVWTDASAARNKRYIGDVENVLDKAKKLETLGVYVGANASENSEKHYSPTAEEFYSTFGLGLDPAVTDSPGIAPKDVGWLAVKMAMELDKRLSILEGANDSRGNH